MIRSVIVGAILLMTASMVQAAQELEYSGSGFYTLAAGKMLGGTRSNVMDYNCPCFISDYAKAGVYDGRNSLQWSPDSKLGLQGNASYHNFSLAAQVVAHGASGSADIEWLYGSYALSDKFTLQAGRQRLPMFYYSDVQDMGFILPWTHLPPGPYGWEAVNYNGLNLRYQDRWLGWQSNMNLLMGSESNHDSGYYKVTGYGRQSQSSIKWSHILGGDLSLSRDGLETRLVYIQSDTQQNMVSNGWDFDPASPTYQTYAIPPGPINPPAKQQIFGLAFNADMQNWLLRTEFNQINHPGLGFRDHAELVGIGYRLDKWKPMLTWSEYRGTTVNSGLLPDALPFPATLQQTITLTLRYDLTNSSALKLQYDSQTDHSDPAYKDYGYYLGSSRLLTVAYDRVF